MNRGTIFFWLIIPFSLFLVSCGTSTGSRYPQEQAGQKKEGKDSTMYSENFDLSKYHAKIDIKEKNHAADSTTSDVFYSYNSSQNSTDTAQTVIKTLPGYRVLVLSTDNLDDANSLRSEIYFKTNHAAVYVIFDPPFYKVEAGDFTVMNDAQSLYTKLKQLGYNDVRVISETVNKFK